MATSTIQVPDVAWGRNTNFSAQLVTYDNMQPIGVNGTTAYYNRTLEFALDQRIGMSNPGSSGLYGGSRQWDLAPIFGTIVLIEFTGTTYTWVKNGSTTTRTGFKFYDSVLSTSNWPTYNEIGSTPWAIGMNGSGNPTPSSVNSKLLQTHIWNNYSRTGNHYLTTVARCTGTWSETYYYLYKFRIYGTPPNTPPEAPIIVWPSTVVNPTTYNSKPWFKAEIGHDDDNDEQTCYYKVDSTGTYTQMNTTGLYEHNTIEKQHTSTLTPGLHTVYMKSYDGAAYSPEVSRNFNVATAVHDPTGLAVGDLISLANISKLESQIQTQLKYYGVSNTNIMDTQTDSNGNIKINSKFASNTNGALNQLRTALMNDTKCPACAEMKITGDKAEKNNSIDVLLTALGNA